ncbi:hypothetical protein JW877_04685 [bacterium]|nr:hypothetical protein [bacterium]
MATRSPAIVNFGRGFDTMLRLYSAALVVRTTDGEWPALLGVSKRAGIETMIPFNAVEISYNA